MLSEETSEKSITISMTMSKVTAKNILKMMGKILKRMMSKSKNDGLKHGKITLKQLQKHNDGLSSIELKTPDLKTLYKVMKKNGIDFSAVKDGKGMYSLFFKGKDIDTVKHAFKKYIDITINRDKSKGLSISDQLAAAKKLMATLNAGRSPEKNRSRGAIDR